MTIYEVETLLETLAPLSLQEDYDNAGLLTGSGHWPCSGILVALDATEAVVAEAVASGCNLVVTHHPIIFKGLKKINGKNYVERAIIAAIKHDVALYAIHTNLDNVAHGVNNRIAEQLGLINKKVLLPKAGQLKKLYTYVPVEQAETVRAALFEAGAGHIGNYSECSFNAVGTGTFKPGEGTHPFVGTTGQRHREEEVKLELVFPAPVLKKVIAALLQAHPYEEVAYDIVTLQNNHPAIGSGMMGELPETISETQVLQLLKDAFHLQVIRHTPLLNKPVKCIAVCGGAGSFLIPAAIGAGADLYVTSDVKYHEFFDADNRLLLADIGHWESEQFTADLLVDVLRAKFTTFAVLKSKVKTNPVNYFI